MSTYTSYILVYLIVFITDSRKTNGLSLKNGFQLETTDSSGNLPVRYGDWENEDSTTTTTAGAARRKKEVAGNAVSKEEKLRKLFEKLNEYKNGGKSKTSTNGLLSNGWGAGGMPFNVLYTPNSHQQKILRFIPKNNNDNEKQRCENDLAYVTQRQKNELEQKQRQQQQQQHQQHVTPRKYFSVIPQLFASYGWRNRY